MARMRLGIIGCGDISGDYLRNLRDLYSDHVEVRALADLVPEKAQARAAEFGIAETLTPQRLIRSDQIDLVLNLTIPAVHEELTASCLENGKHVYSEKPLALTRKGIQGIRDLAVNNGLRVGCAPDTFMSAPFQTAKKIIEEGWIGTPVGTTAICPMRGNEYHRPDVDFFYQKGAGPMLDNAPYWINILVSILGPVRSVVAQTRITFPERTIWVKPRRGEKIKVEVPTYEAGVLEFEQGSIGTFISSFDIWKSRTPAIEIYGEDGTVVLPWPGHYWGEVLISRNGDSEWRPCPQLNEFDKLRRGAGLVDMIHGIQTGAPHKANLDLAYHVTDVIFTFEEAASEGLRKTVESRCERPAGLWQTEDKLLWR